MPRKVRRRTRRVHPKSPAARQYHEEVFLPRLKRIQADIQATPLTVLVWGPGESDSLVYDARLGILNRLRDSNIDAEMSESLTTESPEWSFQSQEFFQAKAADLIVVLCASPGSIAEVAAFSAYPEIASKMVVFLDQDHVQSYVAKGPGRDISAFGSVHYYKSPDDLIAGQLIDDALFVVRNYQKAAWYRKNEGGAQWPK